MGDGARHTAAFVDSTYNGASDWTLQVTNIDSARMAAIDLEIDGTEDLTEGRIQEVSDTMLYYASPIN